MRFPISPLLSIVKSLSEFSNQLTKTHFTTQTTPSACSKQTDTRPLQSSTHLLSLYIRSHKPKPNYVVFSFAASRPRTTLCRIHSIRLSALRTPRSQTDNVHVLPQLPQHAHIPTHQPSRLEAWTTDVQEAATGVHVLSR